MTEIKRSQTEFIYERENVNVNTSIYSHLYELHN